MPAYDKWAGVVHGCLYADGVHACIGAYVLLETLCSVTDSNYSGAT